MRPFLDPVLRVAVILESIVRTGWSWLSGLFLDREEADRREWRRFESFKRRELEAERLDRLRNPQNYRGK